MLTIPAQERWSGKQKDNKQRDIRSFLPPPLDASAALTGRDGSMSVDSPHAVPDRKVRAHSVPTQSCSLWPCSKTCFGFLHILASAAVFVLPRSNPAHLHEALARLEGVEVAVQLQI